jgi:DNA-binding XRE family transcriptional regulator/uncharacterized protein YbaR (Trm112 family)/SAM-dependent methyltransferase
VLLNELGDKIRERRERNNYTQLELATKLNVSPQAVSRWEHGENAPDITIFATLASVLGVSTDWLLSGLAVHIGGIEAMSEWLCCPYCKGPIHSCPSVEPDLKIEPDLRCEACDTLFPFIYDVPVMLPLAAVGFISDRDLYHRWKNEFSSIALQEYAVDIDGRCGGTTTYRDLMYETTGQLSRQFEELNTKDYARFEVQSWHNGTKALRDMLCNSALVHAKQDGLVVHVGMGEQIAYQLAEIANRLRIVTIDRGVLVFERQKLKMQMGKSAPYFIAADIRKLPFRDNAVDVFVDFTGTADTLECDSAIGEIHRATKPGGFVVLGGFDEVFRNGAKTTSESLDLRKLLGKSLGFEWTVDAYVQHGFQVAEEHRGVLPGTDKIPKASVAILQRT